jgi:predicted nucleic acid-binding protein
MAQEVCVDASLVIKWHVPVEEYSDLADLLACECEQKELVYVAPDFVFAEASSGIRRQVYRGLIPVMHGLRAVAALARTPIKIYTCHDLFLDAWALAQTYNRSKLYDCYYLALAEQRGCDFWTADEKFLNAVGNHPRVKHIKDFKPGMLGV